MEQFKKAIDDLGVANVLAICLILFTLIVCMIFYGINTAGNNSKNVEKPKSQTVQKQATTTTNKATSQKSNINHKTVTSSSKSSKSVPQAKTQNTVNQTKTNNNVSQTVKKPVTQTKTGQPVKAKPKPAPKVDIQTTEDWFND